MKKKLLLLSLLVCMTLTFNTTTYVNASPQNNNALQGISYIAEPPDLPAQAVIRNGPVYILSEPHALENLDEIVGVLQTGDSIRAMRWGTYYYIHSFKGCGYVHHSHISFK